MHSGVSNYNDETRHQQKNHHVVKSGCRHAINKPTADGAFKLRVGRVVVPVPLIVVGVIECGRS